MGVEEDDDYILPGTNEVGFYAFPIDADEAGDAGTHGYGTAFAYLYDDDDGVPGVHHIHIGYTDSDFGFVRCIEEND